MKKAVVLLSGGIDSTTTLALVHSQGYAPYALTIRYGQRNYPELEAAQQAANLYGAVEHRMTTIDMDAWGGSALTDHTIAVPHEASDEIPITYVPARNTIMLSLALSWAETIGASDLFYGANQVDYANYPDCRTEYIAAFEAMANLGTKAGVEGRPFTVHAPLVMMTKAEIIKTGIALGVDYAKTLSCYDPDSQGRACRQCDACRFRRKGFQEAGVDDVTRYQDE